MDPPISFTPDELALIRDTRFFPAKALIAQKIKRILQQLHGALKEELAISNLLAPDGVDFEIGQFVKGEHLLDFPYQYLDFPKLFTTTEKFAFRSLFWWGHFWVFAWILEGKHLPRYKENLLKSYDQLADQGLYLLMTETPWEWRKDPLYQLEIRKDNQESVAAALASRPFLKIHRFVEFDSSQLNDNGIIQRGRESFLILRPIAADG
jgi:hypothetical protein